MVGEQSTHVARGSERPAGGMRVVILEPDAEVRHTLLRTMDELPGFRLVGESRTWTECESLLTVYLPELLITRVGFTSPTFPAILGGTIFPVMVGLQTADDPRTRSCAFETLQIPLDAKSVLMTMERVRTEIYRRKLDELSTLLQRYMNFSRGFSQYLEAFRVDDSGEREVPTERVMFIAAYGNYLRLHTTAKIHEIRDTMLGMTSRLDPAQFARVHRKFIVNRKHVRKVVRKDGAAMCVLLSNGAEIPVGPNYRAEVDGFENTNDRLSA
jgi:LytTr DNA-binding domain